MTYHLLFDATDPKSPRFIELEDSTGHSISAGEWKQRKDGYVELVLPAPAGWQDIATAPRDGTHFLSFDGVRACVAKSGRYGFFSVPGTYQIKPLYWQPISPPKPLSYEGEQS